MQIRFADHGSRTLHHTDRRSGGTRWSRNDPVWPPRHTAGLIEHQVARRRRGASSRRRRRLVARLAFTAVVGLVVAFVLSRVSAPGLEARAETTDVSRLTAQMVLHPAAPIPGYLLIADRGTTACSSSTARTTSTGGTPAAGRLAMPFQFDDDTFFGPNYDRIISNQEDQNTIQIISFPGRRILWRYGHVNVKSGSARVPQHARRRLPAAVDGRVTRRGRLQLPRPLHRRLRIEIVRQYGTTGRLPTRSAALPRRGERRNAARRRRHRSSARSPAHGSTTSARRGKLRWAVQAPVSYPSDPQLLGPNRILLADYANPGHAIIMTRTGRVLWRYGPPQRARRARPSVARDAPWRPG